MKKILLITTGGTISCGDGDSSLSPSLNGSELIKLAGCGDISDIDFSDLLFIDSTSVAPKHWEKIAREIKEREINYDGFVVTHGTDTLAYTAAMLSFLLIGLDKPVIVTGSQKTMFEESSDAPGNLKNAVKAARCNIAGVYILFGNKIILGTRGYKITTSCADGFISINCDDIGKVGRDKILFHNKNSKSEKVELKPFPSLPSIKAKVATVTVTPGSNGEEIKAFSDLGFEGIIICGYGNGGIPNERWKKAIEYAAEKDVICVMVSQCKQGVIIPSRYAVASELENLGIISGYDMSFESAYCKLLFLLSSCNDKDKIRSLFCKNLCGEISEA